MIEYVPLKVIGFPAVGVGFVLTEMTMSVPDSLQFTLNMLALTVLVAGVFVVMRYRAALEATEAAGRAWREERDAERSKLERLTEETVLKESLIVKLTMQVEELQARADLSPVLERIIRIETMLEQRG